MIFFFIVTTGLVSTLMASINRVPVPSSGHFFKQVTSVHLNVLLSPPFQFILMLNLFV